MENELQTAIKKRLIYAEDLFEPVDFTVLQVRKGGPGGGKTMAMYEQLFRKRVELAPTIDAVEVVRCKDCLYCKDNAVCIRKTKRGGTHSVDRVHANFFCAAGKRRADHGK